MDDTIAKARHQKQKLRQERDAEGQAAAAKESQRIFAPSAAYLRAVPDEGASASGSLPGASASGFLQPATSSASPLVPSPVQPVRPVQPTWDQVRGGPLPIPDLEHKAQGMLENWKLDASAHDVFLHRIPLERERDMLHTFEKMAVGLVAQASSRESISLGRFRKG